MGFDDNKVLKTIGILTYVQVRRNSLSWKRNIWRASEKDWEAKKTMVEDLLEGQPEVNILVDGSIIEAGEWHPQILWRTSNTEAD